MYFWIMLIPLLSCMVQTQDTSLGSTTAVDSESVVVLMASVPKAASLDESTGEMIVLRHEHDRCFWFYLNRFGRLSTGSIQIEDGDSFSGISSSAKASAKHKAKDESVGVKIAVMSDSHEYQVSSTEGIRKLLENRLMRQVFRSIESSGKSGKSLIFFDDVLWAHTDFVREGRPVRPK